MNSILCTFALLLESFNESLQVVGPLLQKLQLGRLTSCSKVDQKTAWTYFNNCETRLSSCHKHSADGFLLTCKHINLKCFIVIEWALFK